MSIVMPIRNEAAHLDQALAAIRDQTYPADRIEVLIVDGGSTDGTIELIRAWSARDDRVSLLGGDGVSTPEAMNVGIDAASGDVVAKVDGHGWINSDFIAVAVDHLAADDRIGCVGGRIVPVADTDAERANSFARFSRLGVGGGVYTAPDRIHSADTVQCGVYRRTALEQAGQFDPQLVYGEDEELNYRLRMAGWRILFDPAMAFHYRVRPTVRSLYRQYFRYGRARAAVVRKHPQFFRFKHAAPAVLVVTLGMSGLAAALNVSRTVGLSVLASYAAVIIGGSAWLAVRNRSPRPDLIAASLLALHVGYGLGTLAGIFDSTARAIGPEEGRGARHG